MNFKVFLNPEILNKIPAKRSEYIKEGLRTLEDPFPGGNKKEIKGTRKSDYRLRIGDYRVFYRIDIEKKAVYIFDILTAEQAHKKYGNVK